MGDTIVAVATPPGRGGIGVVRLSGNDARALGEGLVGRPLAVRQATLGRFATPYGVRDQVVATWFASPHSYTGEDVVEISTHGNPLILDTLVAEAIRGGARHAMPGEFTYRAYLNERLDLVQAEAVADLVEAVSPAQARAACDQLDGTLSQEIRALEEQLFVVVARLEASLDFPDEGYEFIDRGAVATAVGAVGARISSLLERAEAGRVLREGLRVVVCGRANVGKSLLFNALVGSDRAIVTPVAGTTRDVVSAPFVAEGVPCEVVDTAGVRESSDLVEREGMIRAQQARASADVVVVVVDASVPLTGEDLDVLDQVSGQRSVVVLNKADLGVRADVASGAGRRARGAVVEASALTGRGVDRVRREIAVAMAGGEIGGEGPRVTNRRHASALGRAERHLEDAVGAATTGASEEFVLSDLRLALGALQSITGRRAADAVLVEIFSRFCIGK